MCDMTRLYAWRDSSTIGSNCIGHKDNHQGEHTHHTCRTHTHTHVTRVPWLVTWLVYTHNMTRLQGAEARENAEQQLYAGKHTHHTCRMTASHVWHGSLKCVSSIRVTWLVYRGQKRGKTVGSNLIAVTRVIWLIYMCDMTHVQEAEARENTMCSKNVEFKRVTRLIHTCDMTHSQVWHDSFTCVTWFMFTCDVTHTPEAAGWQNSGQQLYHIHSCDMTHTHLWHDSCMRVTWRIYTRDVTHSYVWHDSFTGGRSAAKQWAVVVSVIEELIKKNTFFCVIWLLHTCAMTHSHVWHDSFIRVTWLIHRR